MRRIARGRMRAGMDIRPMKVGRGMPAIFAVKGRAGSMVVGIGVGVGVRGVDRGGGVGEADAEIVVDSVAVVYRVGVPAVNTVAGRVVVIYQGVFARTAAVSIVRIEEMDVLVTVEVWPPV